MLKALGIEWPKQSDISLPIGRSSYTFSAEAQQYFDLDFSSKKGYKSSKSVLIIQEPHNSLTGQFNLYKGLEIFFKDNPGLVNKTIFLAEGYPANQLISTLPLIEQESHPSDENIREVLETYLITGYMAYEWKHQQGIPIIGIEDKKFYQMGRDFMMTFAKNPNELFAKRSFKDGTNIDITAREALIFAAGLRNRQIIKTLIEQRQNYENPLLFVGFAHLKGLNENEFNFVKSFAEEGSEGMFGLYAAAVQAEPYSIGLQQYLVEGKIGFTCLIPKGMMNPSVDENSNYGQLFQIQRQGDRKNKNRELYRHYLESLLEKRKKGIDSITTKPSPQTAAQYVKALKSGVIYESKSETKKGAWFQIPTEIVRKKLGKDTIWDKGIAPRGGNFERLVGANLASNCPVIDHYEPQNKAVYSLKTMDLRSKLYEKQEAIDYTVNGYIEDLSEFSGIHWTPPGAKEPIIISNDEKIGQFFKDRILEIAVPLGSMTETQRTGLIKLQEYAESVNVILDIIEVA